MRQSQTIITRPLTQVESRTIFFLEGTAAGTFPPMPEGVSQVLCVVYFTTGASQELSVLANEHREQTKLNTFKNTFRYYSPSKLFNYLTILVTSN